MRAVIPLLLLGMLGACAPEIPDSGIGFDSEFDARRARELQLAGQAPAGGDQRGRQAQHGPRH